uniref:Uncharacterized protein n=1 Tax=Palpitomonas bilix TaxID=652834 RepID=A0A7S3DAI2_9EUKA|mmetsp:Transcript_26912/g.69196  ORF Transcript_26912/g.69196 Transcript_26912/m.69196 type:complete len:388 (+) Transcript_26912:354-1517(+)
MPGPNSSDELLRKKAAAIARGLGIDFGSSDDSLDEWSSDEDSKEGKVPTEVRGKLRAGGERSKRAEVEIPHYMKPTAAAQKKRQQKDKEGGGEKGGASRSGSNRPETAGKTRKQVGERRVVAKDEKIGRDKPRNVDNSESGLDLARIVDNAIATAFEEPSAKEPLSSRQLSQPRGGGRMLAGGARKDRASPGRLNSGKGTRVGEIEDGKEEEVNVAKESAEEGQGELTRRFDESLQFEEDDLRRRAAELEADIRRLKEKKALKTLQAFESDKEVEVENVLKEFEKEQRKSMIEQQQKVEEQRQSERKRFEAAIDDIQRQIEGLLRKEQETRASAAAADADLKKQYKMVEEEYESAVASKKSKLYEELSRSGMSMFYTRAEKSDCLAV